MREIIISMLLLCLPVPVMALPSDKDQPIHIEADSLLVDEPAGISTYEGNVHYTQGSISMTADKMVVYGEQGVLQRLEVFGEPAKYNQILSNDDNKVYAEALTIEYFADTGQVLLKGNALIIRGENEFTGNRIVYDSHLETVRAQKAESGKERVQMVIQPRQKSTGGGDTAASDSQ